MLMSRRAASGHLSFACGAQSSVLPRSMLIETGILLAIALKMAVLSRRMRCQMTTETQPSHWPSTKFGLALAAGSWRCPDGGPPECCFSTGLRQVARCACKHQTQHAFNSRFYSKGGTRPVTGQPHTTTSTCCVAVSPATHCHFFKVLSIGPLAPLC